MSVVEPLSVAGVIAELLAPVWIEFTMFSFVVIMYLASSGITVGLKVRSGSGTKSPECKVESPSFWPPSKDLSQASLDESAVALSQMSNDDARKVLAENGTRLLLLAAKSPELNDALVAAFTGKIEARALEAAVMESIKRKDFTTIRRLHRLAGAICVIKSQRTLDAFAKAFNRDAGALRSLCEEASTPLSRPFAETMLRSWAEIREPALMAEVLDRVDAADVAALRIFAEEAAVTVDKKYAMAIQALSKSGDLNGAIAKFEKLSHRGQASNTPVYNSIIEACLAHNDLHTAKVLFAQAREQGVSTATIL